MKLTVRLVMLVVGVALVITTVLSVLDTLLTGEPITAGDVATDFIEMIVLSGAIVFSVLIIERLRNLEGETIELRRELSDAADAGRVWRAQSEHLFQGLSAAVATQFDEWGLTPAEAEIAALLLKGVAMKDIAVLRKTSSPTIRQQAQANYRKTGIGRAHV